MLATPSVKDVVTTVAQQTTPDTHAQLKDDLWNVMFDAGPLVSPPLQQLSERAAAIVDAGGVQATTAENDADTTESSEKVQTTLAGQTATDDGTQAAHDDVEEGTSKSGQPLPPTVYRRVLKDIERQAGLEPPQLADLREQESKTDTGTNQEELPISRLQLSHEFAVYGDPEKGGNFLKQFSRGYLNVEQEEVTTDKEKTVYASVSDLRTVFNTIVEIVYQKHGRGSDNYPDELGMEKRQQGAFAAQLKEQIEGLSTDVEIKSARPYIDGERTRVWFGIELTDRARKLLQMADEVTEEN